MRINRKASVIMTFIMVVVLLAALTTTAFAGGHKVNGFVCPVQKINEKAFENSDNFKEIGFGYYTNKVPIPKTQHIMVPEHATNDNGAGIPGVGFAAPGDEYYSPIWAKQEE